MYPQRKIYIVLILQCRNARLVGSEHHFNFLSSQNEHVLYFGKNMP